MTTMLSILFVDFLQLARLLKIMLPICACAKVVIMVVTKNPFVLVCIYSNFIEK
jgi:hypothetical protein